MGWGGVVRMGWVGCCRPWRGEGKGWGARLLSAAVTNCCPLLGHVRRQRLGASGTRPQPHLQRLCGLPQLGNHLDRLGCLVGRGRQAAAQQRGKLAGAGLDLGGHAPERALLEAGRGRCRHVRAGQQLQPTVVHPKPTAVPASALPQPHQARLVPVFLEQRRGVGHGVGRHLVRAALQRRAQLAGQVKDRLQARQQVPHAVQLLHLALALLQHAVDGVAARHHAVCAQQAGAP